MNKKQVMDDAGQMITALRDGLHGLHLSRMALVAEARALRLAGRRAERDRVWARVEEITAQIDVTNRELAEHMLRAENETRRRGDAETRWTELIPCPFCGGGASAGGGMGGHWCFCTVCGASGRIRGTRQHAVDAWNTRTAYLPDDHNADGKPKTKQRKPRTEWTLQAQKKVAAIWVAWRRNHNTKESGGREIDCFEEHKDTLPVCIKTAKDFQNCKECARKHGLIPKKENGNERH